jgi:predicted outer membrane lipoprotein
MIFCFWSNRPATGSLLNLPVLKFGKKNFPIIVQKTLLCIFFYFQLVSAIANDLVYFTWHLGINLKCFFNVPNLLQIDAPTNLLKKIQTIILISVHNCQLRATPHVRLPNVIE